MTDDLIAFLRAQLDDDERVALAVQPDMPAPWEAYGSELDAGVVAEDGGIIRDGDGGMRHATAEHIARWDPDRVLAEVEAKRRVLNMWTEWHATAENGTFHGGRRDTLMEVIENLAQPYAGRPGWREEWRA